MSADKKHIYNGTETGRRIRKQRRILDMTAEELSYLVGCTRNHIYNIELGGEKPSLDLMMKISEALGVTMDELLGMNLGEYQIKGVNDKDDLKKYLSNLMEMFDPLFEDTAPEVSTEDTEEAEPQVENTEE